MLKPILKNADCLDTLADIEDAAISLIVADLPYQTTECAWDSAIPLDQLWSHWKRVLKANGVVVAFGSQPFTSTLICSNPSWFKYEWIWSKNRPTGFVHAKNKPMKAHENILIFSEGKTDHVGRSKNRMTYNPQNLIEVEPKTVKRTSKQVSQATFGARPSHREFKRSATNYPRSVLEFDTDRLALHPTGKPVYLVEYLIRTYTEAGDVVLDCAMGSGTTGVACNQSGRNFIGIEQDKAFFEIAVSRIIAPDPVAQKGYQRRSNRRDFVKI